MDGNPGARRDGADGAPPAPATPGGEVPSERYGPLELRRMRKDDGRSLILFSRADGGADEA